MEKREVELEEDLIEAEEDLIEAELDDYYDSDDEEAKTSAQEKQKLRAESRDKRNSMHRKSPRVAQNPDGGHDLDEGGHQSGGDDDDDDQESIKSQTLLEAVGGEKDAEE